MMSFIGATREAWQLEPIKLGTNNTAAYTMSHHHIYLVVSNLWFTIDRLQGQLMRVTFWNQRSTQGLV